MKAKGKMTTPEVVFDLYLSMSEREALALYSVTQAIGGPDGGPREVFSELADALVNLLGHSDKKVRDYMGSLKFGTWEEFTGELEA